MSDEHYTDRNTLVVDETLLPAEAYCEYDSDLEVVTCQVVSRESFIDDWDVGERAKESARELLEDQAFETVSKTFKLEPYQVID